MTCRLKHEEEGVIPVFLCRACHPELNQKRAVKTPPPVVCEPVEW